MKDPVVFLNHIDDAIKLIAEFTKGYTKATFFHDKLVQSAVVRQIEIIGEAAKNLPDSFQKKYHGIPWKDMAGMRDKLIHHYFGVDLNYIWNVVNDDLHLLKDQIQKILDEHE